MNGLIIGSTKPENAPCISKVFPLLKHSACNYNWLVSDYECNHYPSEKILINKDYVWLAGTELENILKSNTIQFIWGVITAYEKDILLEQVLEYPLPCSEEYVGFWMPDVTMQNPLSKIEIISLDSSLLLIIAESQEIIVNFAKAYPDSQDLTKYSASLRARYKANS